MDAVVQVTAGHLSGISNWALFLKYTKKNGASDWPNRWYQTCVAYKAGNLSTITVPHHAFYSQLSLNAISAPTITAKKRPNSLAPTCYNPDTAILNILMTSDQRIQ
jgi:hypothetical protein